MTIEIPMLMAIGSALVIIGIIIGIGLMLFGAIIDNRRDDRLNRRLPPH